MFFIWKIRSEEKCETLCWLKILDIYKGVNYNLYVDFEKQCGHPLFESAGVFRKCTLIDEQTKQFKFFK